MPDLKLVNVKKHACESTVKIILPKPKQFLTLCGLYKAHNYHT